MNATLVFDMGGTRTRYAHVIDGKLKNVVKTATDSSADGFDRFLQAVIKHSEGYNIQAVVGGLPGQCTGPEGHLTLAPNLPDWIGTPVYKRLRDAFGVDVHVFNDVVLGGIGEAHYGSGVANKTMAYFTISTGTNAVRIVNGRADETIGRYEVGRMIMGLDGGKAIDFEQTVGGAALQRRIGRPPHEIRDDKLWLEYARRVAVGVYNVSLLWDPEVIVFGGSMMKDIKLPAVTQYLEELPPALLKIPLLRYAKLGDEMGLHGALAWVTLRM
jgi:predicted NBD/HSP70 family sugar kinase